MQIVVPFSESNAKMKSLLGGKGANLGEMFLMGLPIPDGFTITTEVCNYFLENNTFPESFLDVVRSSIKKLEEKTNKKFGDDNNPLFVSVRSGASISMPGMMDTILNLGLNDKTVEVLAEKTGDSVFAYNSYERFLRMYGEIVLNLDKDLLRKTSNIEDLKTLVKIPADAFNQLIMAIEAVFNSWNNERAIKFRDINQIPHNLGTAVNIQEMVFGNLNDKSGTGVLFTRNPLSGDNSLYGEFLEKAQGEDVVAGIRTPYEIRKLRERGPDLYKELEDISEKLETNYKDVQDIEFTIEDGKLFILQTRSAKRTIQASIKVAYEMAQEGLITKEEAVRRIDVSQIDKMLHPQIDQGQDLSFFCKGLSASPGAATGKIVLDADKAYEWVHERDEKVILVRKETCPEDIHGMHVSEGILTATGGTTSHAAVVARSLGTPCVCGANELKIDYEKRTIQVGDLSLKEGDEITIDGTNGNVYLGTAEMIEPEMTNEFIEILKWAKEISRMDVRVNADNAKETKLAIEFGANGIGLCRTEHMFFEEDRINFMREMILAKDKESRKVSLSKLLPFQKNDFREIFKVAEGKPVVIRLLDPPLHEFLTFEDDQLEVVAKKLSIEVGIFKSLIEDLKEVNPMLGHRGCRLAITYPEIYEMQAQAVVEAAIEANDAGIGVHPEIEIPLVSSAEEVRILREIIENVIQEYKLGFNVKIGVMIELPRACINADKITDFSDFLTFGTNDLTQTTFGFSRDDSSKFLPEYIEKGLILDDPFKTIDTEGVGELMRMAVERARNAKPDIEFGICGEHGGEHKSIQFCEDIGLSYVSCSTYRIPGAIISAAQAKLA